MKTVKPSKHNAKSSIIGCIFGLLFAIFWIVMAFKMGAFFMAPFGLIFIVILTINLVRTIKFLKNDDTPPICHIVDDNEKVNDASSFVDTEFLPKNGSVGFCPYCGKPIEKDFEFCKFCGRKLPK